jgi:hypothetical protein
MTITKKGYLSIDIIVTLSVIALSIASICYADLVWFGLGLGNALKVSFMGWMLTLLAPFILSFVASIVLIVRSVVQRKISSKILTIRAGLILICIATPFAAEHMRPAGYLPFTQGFWQRMHATARIPEIQEWLKSLNTSDNKEISSEPNSSSAHELPNIDNQRDTYGTARQMQPTNQTELERIAADTNQLPECVESLSPQYVDLNKTKDGEIELRLTWGSGFGHWGMVICSASTAMPVSDNREYRLPLSGGAYVFYELQ